MVVALALAAFQLILKPGKSFKHIALLLFTITIMAIFVMPQLNSLTSGTVTERYSDFETTGRIELIEADLELFKNNQPFWGRGRFVFSNETIHARHGCPHGVFAPSCRAWCIWRLFDIIAFHDVF